MNKEKILSLFSLFRFGNRGGIGAFLTPETDEEVFHRLFQLASGTPLSLQELNQLLVLAHEASITPGFFEYYWLETPEHTYDVTAIEGYESKWFDPRPATILSLEHLKWGFYRLYVDGLLYFGNVRTAFRQFRIMHKEELRNFFRQRRIDTNALRSRGEALALKSIPKRHRHLVSEKAGKCLGSDADGESELRRSLLEAWHLHRCSGGARTSLGEMLRGDDVKCGLAADRHERMLFSASNLLDEFIENEQQIEEKSNRIASEYEIVRIAALRNTDLYLSMVNEMDVYVARRARVRRTWMRRGRSTMRVPGLWSAQARCP